MDCSLSVVSRRRQLLEPLRIAYQTHVLDQAKDPCDVVLQIGDRIVVGGETLKAVHECWLEYKSREEQLKKFTQIEMQRANC